MKRKILYIMGYSRSGSTLLDTVLSAHDDMFGAGELVNLIPAMYQRGEYCACGVPSKDCGFWTDVMQRWQAYDTKLCQSRYLDLQAYYGRYRRYLDYGRVGGTVSPQFETYLRSTRALFEAIGAASNCSWVIDSSKHPIRPLVLAQMNNIDVYVIHLVRDVCGVVHSAAKPKHVDPAAGVVKAVPGRKARHVWGQWMLCNFVADRVRHRFGRRALFLRHEDFVADPESALKRIERLTGEDFGAVAETIRYEQGFNPAHTVAGNRLRMRGGVKIRRQQTCGHHMPLWRRKALSLAASPLTLFWNLTEKA